MSDARLDESTAGAGRPPTVEAPAIDAFAEFGIPRAAVVDVDDLTRRFDALSRERHPDAGGDAAAFARLSEARSLLASPARRLRHLLDLSFPGTPVAGPLPNEIMTLFGDVGPALHGAGQLLARKRAATTPLARALLAPDEMKSRETLESLASVIHGRLDGLSESASRWDGSAGALAELTRESAFLEKWQAQVRDSLRQLGM